MSLIRPLNAWPLKAAPRRKHFVKCEIWMIVQLMGKVPEKAERFASHEAESQVEKHLHPYLEAAIKGAIQRLFLGVSDLLSALDWLILTLVSSTWTWSECKSQVCVRVRASAYIWGHALVVYVAQRERCVCVCLCVCACTSVWLRLRLRLLWSLSKRPEGTDNIHSSIYHPSISLSVFFLTSYHSVFLSLPQFNNWIQVS